MKHLIPIYRLLSLSACSTAYDTNLGSHTHDVLTIAATEIIVYSHRRCGTSTLFFIEGFPNVGLTFFNPLWGGTR